MDLVSPRTSFLRPRLLSSPKISPGGKNEEKIDKEHIVELQDVKFCCEICNFELGTRICTKCNKTSCEKCQGCDHEKIPLDTYHKINRITTKELKQNVFMIYGEEKEGLTSPRNSFSTLRKEPQDLMTQRIEYYLKNIDGAFNDLESREKEIKDGKITLKMKELEERMVDMIHKKFDDIRKNIISQKTDNTQKIEEQKKNLQKLKRKTLDYHSKSKSNELVLDVEVVEDLMYLDNDVPVEIQTIITKEQHLMIEIQNELKLMNQEIQNMSLELTKNYNSIRSKMIERIYNLRNVKNWTQVFKVSEELISMNPKDFVAWSYKGESLYSLGRTKEAEKCFDKIFEETKDSPLPEDDYARARAYFTLQDYREAAKLFQNASSKNHIPSIFNLGFCYGQGMGLPKNITLSAKLYHKAALGGFSNAQYNLGVLYYTGIGVEQSHDEAVKWFFQAAKKGLPMACSNLGVCYFEGTGSIKDHKQAIKCYETAAIQGLTSACYNLGWCYASGTGVKKDLKISFQWYTKAACAGLSNAQYKLGMIYEEGIGVEKDLQEAIYWYEKANAQKNEKAKEKLSIIKPNKRE